MNLQAAGASKVTDVPQEFSDDDSDDERIMEAAEDLDEEEEDVEEENFDEVLYGRDPKVSWFSLM